MKKILLVAIMAVALQAGGVWSLVKNSGLEVMKPLTYTMEVSGVNARVYEFTPKSDKESICIAVFTSEIHQLSCYKKEVK